MHSRHWLPIYTSPAVPLIKLCTPHTNRARIHPWEVSFLNLSRIHILFLFNKRQHHFSVPCQGHLNDETLQESKPKKKKKNFSGINFHLKKGSTSKKEDMRILFSTLLESSKVKTSKNTQRTKKCLGRYKVAIETALKQFHQDKMCALKAKDGNRESKQKKKKEKICYLFK